MVYNKNIISEGKIMPKYKDSPELRTAKQERKDKLKEYFTA